MNNTFTTRDMKLLIEALVHLYMTFKTTYYETRDPWDQKMMYDYRDVLRKVEDLTGQQYVPTLVRHARTRDRTRDRARRNTR
mgnify:CR=1 FL=1